jgi:hypothetical protein
MKTGSEELGQDDRKRAGELLKALQNLLFTCLPSWEGWKKSWINVMNGKDK